VGTAADVLAWARAQLGVTESPPNSNRVRYWADAGMAKLQGQPWCDAFVSAAFKLHGVDVPPQSYCPYSEAWYRKGGRLVDVTKAQPGDQVLFHFAGEANEANHTGILESIDLAKHTVTCLEGNTAPGSAGSQSNGGGVYRRTRSFSVVRAVGRPPYSEGDDMALSDEDVKKVAAAVAGAPKQEGITNLGDLASLIKSQAGGGAAIDYDVLAEKVVAHLAKHLAT
jgi:hypothetical protein